MPALALLLAQCVGPAEKCELPNQLPWYFGLAIAAAWAVAIVGIVALVHRRLVARRAERRERARSRQPRVDEQTPGTEIDRW